LGGLGGLGDPFFGLSFFVAAFPGLSAFGGAASLGLFCVAEPEAPRSNSSQS
jgi:hypothetical protein